MERTFRVVGLEPNQCFIWNGRTYRQFDTLVINDDTDPEALRHLLHYPDCLMVRGVVEEIKPKKAAAPPKE